MNAILFGFKGVGKTYFGQLLAKKHSLVFLDADQLIEKNYGKTIRQIVLEKGEKHFRQIEEEILCLIHPKNTILSLGGGAICNPRICAHMQKLGTLVHLRQDKLVLQKRMLSGILPTFLDKTEPLASFEKIYSTRIAMYATIPAKQIDLFDKTDEEILVELWQVISSEISFALPLGENPMAKR